MSNYLTIKSLRLTDTRMGVMVIYFGSSMGIMLLRQCYKTIPKALEEAVNDPFIHEVVDLFGGSVVDIHR